MENTQLDNKVAVRASSPIDLLGAAQNIGLVLEQIDWILKACEIDRDAFNELKDIHITLKLHKEVFLEKHLST